MSPVFIPETIVVHLGSPDSNAQNVTVNFPDYIKNVASSEVYPTWPESSLKANILAQISFALNRVYTEYYRSRGYDFDITSSPAYDQAYNPQRSTFENISEIVDEIFNNYIAKGDQFFPLFARYCDGKAVKCSGLSQWGSVDLANQGKTPLEILQYYYGNDVKIVENAPIKTLPQSFPGTPLRRGDAGLNVLLMQVDLNRIARNYPGIGIIPEETLGYFGETTEKSVKEFQKIFNLTQDGIVGKATWYKILYVYIAVKRLAEIDAETVRLENVPKAFRKTVKKGDSGNIVNIIQYMLNVVSMFDNRVLSIKEDGIYSEKTENSVKSFQESYGLDVDGIVGQDTWNALSSTYSSFKSALPPEDQAAIDEGFPGNRIKQEAESTDAMLEGVLYW